MENKEVKQVGFLSEEQGLYGVRNSKDTHRWGEAEGQQSTANQRSRREAPSSNTGPAQKRRGAGNHWRHKTQHWGWPWSVRSTQKVGKHEAEPPLPGFMSLFTTETENTEPWLCEVRLVWWTNKKRSAVWRPWIPQIQSEIWSRRSWSPQLDLPEFTLDVTWATSTFWDRAWGAALVEGVCVVFFFPSFTLLIFERGAKIPEGKDRIVVSVERLNVFQTQGKC